MRILPFVIAASVFMVATPATADPLCSVGDKAQVLWKEKWYPAKVTKVNEDQSKCFIRYDGYGSEWDEWVSSGRFKKTGSTDGPSYKVGDSVQVKWKGTWYPASVISAKNSEWKIHYDGYENSWDEWVKSDRIKLR